jgi:hydroxymethylglutaryl-CoA synthase
VADFEFACKAGTEAMFVAHGLVEAGRVEYALGIGADTSQGAPNDALEFSASAGGAAFIFGNKNVLVEVVDTYSYTSDTPDFWRREGEFYPRHGGRFTGEPAYFKHVLAASGKTLGFKKEQLETGWVVRTMGNTYSGSSPTGLAAILDVADPGDLILITSFGSGAASDSFVLRATAELPKRRPRAPTVRSFLDGRRRYLTYGEYSKYREKIIVNE